MPTQRNPKGDSRKPLGDNVCLSVEPPDFLYMALLSTDKNDRDSNTLAAKRLIGTARASIPCLKFIEGKNIGREVDNTNVSHLINVFRKTRCRRYDPDNFIPVLITQNDLKKALKASGLTQGSLKAPAQDGSLCFLKTARNQTLSCVYGRHRLKAAEAFLNKDDQWWTVEIYLVNSHDDFTKLASRWKDDFHHQERLSDGEVYRRIRTHRKQNGVIQKRQAASLQENLWLENLSSGKQISLHQLLRNADFTTSLDALLDFPGLWGGLELGNVQRHLALRCDEEVTRYLRHTKRVWDRITLQREDIRKAVDIQTVEALQLRTPGISKIDKDFVVQGMHTGLLFSKVVDLTTRKMLKDSILSIQCLIPSIKSMHENLKYIEIGATILKDLVVGKNNRGTIQSILRSIWEVQKPQDLLVESAPGIFQIIPNVSDELGWDLTYKQLWILILRTFADIGGRAPRKEVEENLYEAKVDPNIKYYFLNHVSNLGLGTERVQDALQNDPRRQQLRYSLAQVLKLPSTELEEVVEDMMRRLPVDGVIEQGTDLTEQRLSQKEVADTGRRWGVPFTRAYETGKATFYLPQLQKKHGRRSDEMPCVSFIEQDFIEAFFGPTMPFLDKLLDLPEEGRNGESVVDEGSGNSSPSEYDLFDAEDSSLFDSSAAPASMTGISTVVHPNPTDRESQRPVEQYNAIPVTQFSVAESLQPSLFSPFSSRNQEEFSSNLTAAAVMQLKEHRQPIVPSQQLGNIGPPSDDIMTTSTVQLPLELPRSPIMQLPQSDTRQSPEITDVITQSLEGSSQPPISPVSPLPSTDIVPASNIETEPTRKTPSSSTYQLPTEPRRSIISWLPRPLEAGEIKSLLLPSQTMAMTSLAPTQQQQGLGVSYQTEAANYWDNLENSFPSERRLLQGATSSSSRQAIQSISLPPEVRRSTTSLPPSDALGSTQEQDPSQQNTPTEADSSSVQNQSLTLASTRAPESSSTSASLTPQLSSSQLQLNDLNLLPDSRRLVDQAPVPPLLLNQGRINLLPDARRSVESLPPLNMPSTISSLIKNGGISLPPEARRSVESLPSLSVPSARSSLISKGGNSLSTDTQQLVPFTVSLLNNGEISLPPEARRSLSSSTSPLISNRRISLPPDTQRPPLATSTLNDGESSLLTDTQRSVSSVTSSSISKGGISLPPEARRSLPSANSSLVSNTEISPPPDNQIEPLVRSLSNEEISLPPEARKSALSMPSATSSLISKGIISLPPNAPSSMDPALGSSPLQTNQFPSLPASVDVLPEFTNQIDNQISKSPQFQELGQSSVDLQSGDREMNDALHSSKEAHPEDVEMNELHSSKEAHPKDVEMNDRQSTRTIFEFLEYNGMFLTRKQVVSRAKMEYHLRHRQNWKWLKREENIFQTIRTDKVINSMLRKPELIYCLVQKDSINLWIKNGNNIIKDFQGTGRSAKYRVKINREFHTSNALVPDATTPVMKTSGQSTVITPDDPMDWNASSPGLLIAKVDRLPEGYSLLDCENAQKNASQSLEYPQTCLLIHQSRTCRRLVFFNALEPLQEAEQHFIFEKYDCRVVSQDLRPIKLEMAKEAASKGIIVWLVVKTQLSFFEGQWDKEHQARNLPPAKSLKAIEGALPPEISGPQGEDALFESDDDDVTSVHKEYQKRTLPPAKTLKAIEGVLPPEIRGPERENAHLGKSDDGINLIHKEHPASGTSYTETNERRNSETLRSDHSNLIRFQISDANADTLSSVEKFSAGETTRSQISTSSEVGNHTKVDAILVASHLEDSTFVRALENGSSNSAKTIQQLPSADNKLGEVQVAKKRGLPEEEAVEMRTKSNNEPELKRRKLIERPTKQEAGVLLRLQGRRRKLVGIGEKFRQRRNEGKSKLGQENIDLDIEEEL